MTKDFSRVPFVKIVAFCVCIGLLVISCRKDENFQLDNSNFTLSQDTLLFDTVFTTIGSATKRVKIFNNETDPISINVRLENGDASMFRMNVDGFQGKNLNNIEIPAKDSIYVFMEVTVDPDNPLSISPYVIEDKLIISQESKSEVMQLIAWGQNANYLSQRGAISALTCGNSSITFDDDKPYVIYGILIIDSCELIIPAGRSIHIHGGVVTEPGLVYNDGQIIIFPEGKLTVNGTLDNPVKFEGDRLEPDYEDVPGQWVGIRIFQESQGNSIEYAEIKNSIIGVIADSASSVDIKNTVIKNTTGASIIGIHANIYGENLLLHSSDSYNIQLTYGGDYTFNYCTLVNQSNQREALYINNYKCTDLENDPLCQSSVSFYRGNLNLKNSIIYGPSEDEIGLDDYTQGSEPNLLNYDLSNCIVRVDEILDPEAYPNFFDNCSDCLNYNRDDILFRNEDELDYRLDTMSIAENKALPISNIQGDLLGYTRDFSNPDIGCFEFEN